MLFPKYSIFLIFFLIPEFILAKSARECDELNEKCNDDYLSEVRRFSKAGFRTNMLCDAHKTVLKCVENLKKMNCSLDISLWKSHATSVCSKGKAR